MTLAVALLSSGLAASLTAAALLGVGFYVSRRELAASQDRERVAMERLANARKDGFEIPSPEEVAPVAAPEAPALSKDLQALVDDWEDPVARAAQRREIQRLLDQGMGPAEAYQRLTAPTSPAAT